MPDSVEIVFISSTFEDLREERAEVQKAILRHRCVPVGMELFPAADADAWGFIKGEIERSDYYILIVGNRYGSVAEDGISYTEKEYHLARELKKPCLVFVRSKTMPVADDKREQDEEKAVKLTRFQEELANARLSRRFDSISQLGGDVYFSLDQLRKRRPVQENDGNEYALPETASYGVTITSPPPGQIEERTDVRGTITRTLPQGFSLWIFRLYDDGRYFPLRECLIRSAVGVWEARNCFVGGRPGDVRWLAVYLVGPDGQALTSFVREAAQVFLPVRDQLAELTGNQRLGFLPTIANRTRDMIELQSIEVKRV
jgi:Domain of unknown function (DUF4062)